MKLKLIQNTYFNRNQATWHLNQTLTEMTQCGMFYSKMSEVDVNMKYTCNKMGTIN
jgi:hypothetical protein